MTDKTTDFIEKNIEKLIVVTIVLIFILSNATWVFSSAMEASAYERATGKHVSTWDAMWIELRVQSAPMDGPR